MLEKAASRHSESLWIHRTLIDSIRALKNYSKEERKVVIEQNDGIVVVRDPLDRLVSAWRDKFGKEGVAANVEVKSRFFVRNYGI